MTLTPAMAAPKEILKDETLCSLWSAWAHARLCTMWPTAGNVGMIAHGCEQSWHRLQDHLENPLWQ